MEKTTAIVNLREQIIVLESRRALEEIELRNQFKKAHELLKPSNLIMSAIKDLSSSPEIKGNIMGSLMGMAAGFISKKAAIGGTNNPIKLILGNILENVVATGVSKNSDSIKSTIMNAVQKFLHKEEPQATTNAENNI